MMPMRKLSILSLIGATALSACNPSTGEGPDNAVSGAVIGAGLGAIAGEVFGNDSDDAFQGAVAGAILGGAIGLTLDHQEEEIRRALGDRGVEVANTGSELVVTIPESVTFSSGSSEIRSTALTDIYAVADSLARYPRSDVEVVGHTDDAESDEYNMDLSRSRALAVSQVLIDEGISPRRIVAYGKGATEPVASNFTESGRAKNRRVEIIIRPVAQT